MAAAGLLAACEPKPPEPKVAHAAPAVSVPAMAGTIHASAVPLTTADVSATAAVILSDKPVPAKPGAADTRATAGAPLESLASLAGSVGKYPYDADNYLEQGVLAARLRALMGEEYPLLLANMRTVSPLTAADGLWYITGNRPHEGGVESAAVVIDPRQNALRVWLLNAGQAQEFIDPPTAQVPWPRDVQTLIRNQRKAGS
ncbi:MAG: hypothetical protein ABWY08_19575 [Comamonas sp.]